MEKQNEFYTTRGYQRLNDEKKLLTSSMEDYVEMIYRMSLNTEYIRVNQVARELNVRPSSVTKIIQKLNILGIVYYQKYGVIQLTKKGTEMGFFLYKRHTVIENFLTKLGVTETLLKDTEMIEHAISSSTLEKITIINHFLDSHPEILKMYKNYKEDYLSSQKK
ncbi:metal-dependent transcriptional regulator [Sinanaerobacter sp. ZZT-01]|uniref:metal-dependent transcriptional regulator n=1 Tax=Sinanaerobacter sp. ZZT-01 TaxID=3111540 RepID=UPI002D787E44|nr:iron dependent repressor, metal binding and dimerization domain protein [Sinanaerobacter sp. ZZT-01]WRR92381.1 iron dependent repressor, metal binding and dimerization domain protein [Sinanaerobacter sp. ZZT-01]